MIWVSVGLGIGVTTAWGLAALVEGFLFEIHPHDPAVYGGVLSALIITAVAAALLPARRAALVDPIIAMRAD